MITTKVRLQLVVLPLLLAAAASAQVQRIRVPHHQDRAPGPPVSAQEALKKMTVPEGFSVELVAAEPDIVNPVGMTFDHRGRIWIIESLEYPRRSAGPGQDRIKVLEDTDGDGRADSFSVFADGLNIPSGIAIGYGGVWVANAPDVLFLQDIDGDGRADRREVIVTGFGRQDTHELPNSLTWGPDGWLYGLNGVFNDSHVRYPPSSPHASPDDPGFEITCAMFRIHPRTREFEVFAEGTSNPWGITWDTEGNAFISACVIDHLWHITETGYYHRQGGPYPAYTWKIDSIVSHTHQKAAYCGIEFFDSDAYPPEYGERLYMGNIHGNCINVDMLERFGSTYFGRPAPDFLTANDAWFMPVAQKTGPDGCLYVLDWYDRYHCYQDANRDPEGIDRLRGRLYRVRYGQTPRVTGFDLAAENDDQLIERLRSPNIYFRQTAQRILQERSRPETRQRLEQMALDDTVPQKARMHALWALVGGGPLDGRFHMRLLEHENTALRAWGVRAAGNQGAVDAMLRQQVASMAHDRSPDVRLQVAIASRKLEQLDAMPILVKTLAHAGEDPLIPRIVWQNLHPLLEHESDQVVQHIRGIDLRGAPALVSIMPRIVERVLARQQFSAEPIVALIVLLAEQPRLDESALRPCLQMLSQRIQSREITGQSLALLKAGLEPTVSKILSKGADFELHFDAALLATSWRDPIAIEAVRDVFTNGQAASQRRLDALEALIAAGDPLLNAAARSILANEEKQKPSAKFRAHMIAALGRVDDPQLADLLLEAYPLLEPELQPRVIEMLTQRGAWSKKLLAAVGRREIPPQALNLNQVRRLLSSTDHELVRMVRATWGNVRDSRNPDREKQIAEIKQYLFNHPGDPVAGDKVFQRVCAQCHKIYGQGEDVGPDLTLNGRNSFDQLLSNVLDPSLVIGAAYRATSVATIDGRVLTGLLDEDSPQRIVLKTQGGKQETIARNEIEQLKESDISMMPEELEKQITETELADLFAYLVLDRPSTDPDARRLPGSRQITPRSSSDPDEFDEILAEVAPGFTAGAVGLGGLALLEEHQGRSAVVRTHPPSKERPCVLSGSFNIPARKVARLVLAVSHHPRGDWRLRAQVNGQTALDTVVGPATVEQGWAEYTIDLSPLAGGKVAIELENHANDWSWEFAYWGRAAVVWSN